MSKSTKKNYCSGCRNNVYNNGYLGVNECWSLESAKVVKAKFVPNAQRPPWNMPAEKTLSCHQRTGYARAGEKQTC